MQLDEKKLKKMILEVLSELESSETELEERDYREIDIRPQIYGVISLLQQAAASYREESRRAAVKRAIMILQRLP